MKKEFKKSFEGKEKRERKSERGKDPRQAASGKDFKRKEASSFKPGRKEDGNERPVAKKFPDRKKREDRPAGDRPFDKKRFPDRKDNNGNFSEKRPRKFGDRDVEKKPFGKKIDKSEKPWLDKKERKFTRGKKDEIGEKKLFEKRDWKEKSFNKPGRDFGVDPKPFKKPAPKKNRFEKDDFEDEIPAKKPVGGKSIEEPMTLNKYIAHSGECSRRDAAEFVKQGKVRVNGELILEPGYRVSPGDTVTLSGKKMTPQKNLVYVLLNKPKDYITTTDDPQERKTVMDLVANSGIDRLYPVGRLDRHTTGLLLLTNDGALAHKLSHPSYMIRKVYHVTLDKNLTKTDYEKIFKGVELEDGKAEVDEIAYLENRNEVGLEIHIGRNRIVRRIFESLGYIVEKLDRVMYAGLTKKNLPRGKWRFLDEKEIIFLKHFK